MTQAAPYFKATNFTQYATNNPQAPFPPAALDSELNAIAQFTQTVQSNIALLQRDDGALRDGLVTPSSLALATLVLIGGSGSFNPRGAWQTGQPYIKGDIVTQSNGVYFVVSSHTSGTFNTDVAANRLMQVGVNFLIGYIAADIAFSTNGGLITNNNVQTALIQVQGLIAALQSADGVLQDNIDAFQAQIDSTNAQVSSILEFDLPAKQDVINSFGFFALKTNIEAVQSVATGTLTAVTFNARKFGQTFTVDYNPASEGGSSAFYVYHAQVTFVNTIAAGYIIITVGGVEYARAEIVNQKSARITALVQGVAGLVRVSVFQSSGSAQNLDNTNGKTFFLGKTVF